MTFQLTPDPIKTRRHFGGAKAHHAGKTFEELVEFYARQSPHISLHTLPKAGGRFVPGPKGLRFIPDRHNLVPCDMIGAIKSESSPWTGFFCDCKSTSDSRELPSEMLKPHQVDFLEAMAKADQVAGLMVEARALNLILWRDGLRLREPMPWRAGMGGAISQQWDVIGGREGIDWEMLRTLYQ